MKETSNIKQKAMTESDAFLSMFPTSSQFGLRLSCCHLWVIPVCSAIHSSGGFSQSVSGYSSLPAGLLAHCPFHTTHSSGTLSGHYQKVVWKSPPSDGAPAKLFRGINGKINGFLFLHLFGWVSARCYARWWIQRWLKHCSCSLEIYGLWGCKPLS